MAVTHQSRKPLDARLLDPVRCKRVCAHEVRVRQCSKLHGDDGVVHEVVVAGLSGGGEERRRRSGRGEEKVLGGAVIVDVHDS
jgi:hypothetical protein